VPRQFLEGARESIARLERLGRFVEPYMRRVIAQSKDDVVLANARAILAGNR